MSTLLNNPLPIVGMYFSPPAQLIVDNLPVGAKLYLTPEPDNLHDPNAVAVWVKTEEIPPSALTGILREVAFFGISKQDFLSTEDYQLGYIARNVAQALRETDTVPLNTFIEAQLALNPSGQPRAILVS